MWVSGSELWEMGYEGSVGIEGERFRPVGKEKECAGTHPANPEDIEAQVESFLEQTVAICVHEVLEGEEEANYTGDEENSADEVGDFFGGVFSHHVKGKDEGQLEKGKDGVSQPENAKPVVLVVGGGNPDLADGGDLGDQISLVPAKEKLGEG